MIITALMTELAILCIGFLRLSPGEYYIKIDMITVLEGGLAAASVLISFGVLIGKVNPFQLLALAFIETILFSINGHIGYELLGAIDAGFLNFNICLSKQELIAKSI